MKRGNKSYRIIMIIFLTVVVTSLATVIIMKYNTSQKETIKYVMVGNKTNTLIDKLRMVLNEYYLGEVNEGDMQEAAAKAYIEALNDPYTEYFTSKEYEDFVKEATGSFVGIGIYYGKTVTDNKIIVVSLLKDSPAEKAGILPGDFVIKVDNNEVKEETTVEEVSNWIKGEENTSVNVTVARTNENGEEKEITFTLNRAVVNLREVESEMLEINIGYINIPSFDSGFALEFKNKLNELINNGATSLIIDLRNNGGGVFEESIQIADYFLDKGKTIISTKDNKDNVKTFYSEEDALTQIPIVVLTNSGTASASEILASALRDNNRAQIVGIKTFGKGVIQNVYKLETGGAIKVTISEYYTPIGNKINQLGITPNIEIEVPDGVNIYNIPREKDTQLEKAIEVLTNIE